MSSAVRFAAIVPCYRCNVRLSLVSRIGGLYKSALCGFAVYVGLTLNEPTTTKAAGSSGRDWTGQAVSDCQPARLAAREYTSSIA